MKLFSLYLAGKVIFFQLHSKRIPGKYMIPRYIKIKTRSIFLMHGKLGVQKGKCVLHQTKHTEYRSGYLAGLGEGKGEKLMKSKIEN